MTWTPERWHEIETIFLDAARERPAHRAAFLSSACDGDLELRAVVEMLLAADDAGTGLLEGGAIGLLRADDVLLQLLRQHEARASVLAATGDHTGAVAAAEAGVRIARLLAATKGPALAAALCVLGCHRLAAGDAAGAIAALDEALRIDAATPGRAADEVDAQLTPGTAGERAAHFDGAERALLAALQLAAQTPARRHLLPQIRARLRTFYVQRGQHADAARHADAPAPPDGC